jgi:hypothetical protein
MSRSFRKTPIMGITTARTDKPAKQDANRTLRAATRQSFSRNKDLDELVTPVLREVSDNWSFPKDGKQRIDLRRPGSAKWMRK